MTKLSAEHIAELIGGKVSGDANLTISNVAKLEEATAEDLCFYANPKYESQLYKTKSNLIIVPEGFSPAKEMDATFILHENPYFGFCLILQKYFDPNLHDEGISESAFIHPSAIIGENVSIGHGTYIAENATIGDNAVLYPQVYIGKNAKVGNETVLYPGVKLYAFCEIGNLCIIHAGTVIGSDGFGFAPFGNQYLKIPQIGNVVIGNNVETGSNCAIDRATMGSTIIKDGVKLDNLVQIAHNVEIQENTVIAGQAGVAGSTIIGNNVMIGGQVGVTGHIRVAPYVGIAAQSGVSKEIKEPKSQWMGSPAMPLKDFFKSSALFKNLPKLNREIGELKDKLKDNKN